MTNCLQCGHTGAGEFLYCPRCGTKAPEGGDPGDTLLGRTLNDKYRIVAEIGSGAMGTVYLGEHIGLRKRVALKVLHPDLQVTDEGLRRFQREGIAAGTFNHPNLIQIFDFDKGEGRVFYLAMEYVEGSNLKTYLRRKGRLAIAPAMRITRQILSCLAVAHRHGVVHRDLKPDNLMITTGPDGQVTVKVLDFGLSKLVDRSGHSSMATQQGRILGTPLYMSPEQCAGEEADARSDLYAMGLILYEMLTGLRPFVEESTTDLIFSRATEEAPSLRADFPELEVPEELDRLITRALQRTRDARFPTAEEMLAAANAVPLDLETGSTNTTIMTSTLALDDEARKRRRSSMGKKRRPTGSGAGWKAGVFGALGGAAVLAVIVLAYFMIARPGSISIPGFGKPVRVSEIPEEERTNDQVFYLSLLDLARDAIVQGVPNSALQTLERAAVHSSADEEVYLVKAQAFVAMGALEDALGSYDKAIAGDSSYFDAYLAKGMLLIELGRHQEAMQAVQKAEKLDPENPAVLAVLAALAYERRELDLALDFVERAVYADPKNARANLLRGKVLLGKKNYVEAEDALREARQDIHTAELSRLLAEVHLEQDEVDEAVRELETALELEESAATRLDLGGLFHSLGRYDAAREVLDEGTRRHARDARLHGLLGAAYEGLQQSDEAIAALRKCVALDPNDPEATLLLANLCHKQLELEEAQRFYEKTIELSGSPVASFGLGLLQFTQNEFESARASFQRAIDDTSVPGPRGRISYDPMMKDAHMYLGLLRMRIFGDPRGARASFEEYKSLGGTDPQVERWLRQLPPS